MRLIDFKKIWWMKLTIMMDLFMMMNWRKNIQTQRNTLLNTSKKWQLEKWKKNSWNNWRKKWSKNLCTLNRIMNKVVNKSVFYFWDQDIQRLRELLKIKIMEDLLTTCKTWCNSNWCLKRVVLPAQTAKKFFLTFASKQSWRPLNFSLETLWMI